MALTDREIQRLQGVTLDWSKLSAGKVKKVDPKDKISYEIIHAEHNRGDNLTQAIAVAPVVNGKTDYSQTAIVVTGTVSLAVQI